MHIAYLFQITHNKPIRLFYGGWKMKKVLFLMLMSIGLVALSACGNESETDDVQADVVSQDEEYDEDMQEQSNVTDDPLEFITNDDMLLEDGANLYELKSKYVTDDTDDDGFNVYKDGDFEFRYAVVETENIAEGIEATGSHDIQIMGEIVNDTDKDYFFDERMFIKTDQKEKSELSFALNGAGEADQRSKFLDGFPLEYDIPDSFTLTLIDPALGDMDSEITESGYGEKYQENAYDKFMEDHTVINKEFHKE